MSSSKFVNAVDAATTLTDEGGVVRLPPVSNHDDASPIPTGASKDGNPRVFARVPKEIHDRIDALRDEYPRTDGGRGTMTDVVKSFILDGEPLMDPALRSRLDVVRKARGLATRAEAWRVVIMAGLKALEKSK